ncbi:MAG: flagellar hook-length control protein FliK [Lachnospiraceae bacterium]|nr:flagellar hook-length control protein FliK [Lachnospiraceae bacterium]
MAINLLQNSMREVKGDNNNVSQTSAVDRIVSEKQMEAQMRREILGMLPGATLRGQIVSRDGADAKLLLNNILILDTKIDSDANLPINTPMTFQIKSNNGGQLGLSPLFANTAAQGTAAKALDAAGLPQTEDNLVMVNTLMEKGMSINKDVLNLISKELATYPDYNVEDVVMLHKMGMPVNENNLREINLYNNNNQYIMESIDTLAGGLADTLLQIASENPDELKLFTDSLIELISGSEVGEEGETVTTEQVMVNSEGTEQLTVGEERAAVNANEGKVNPGQDEAVSAGKNAGVADKADNAAIDKIEVRTTVAEDSSKTVDQSASDKGNSIASESTASKNTAVNVKETVNLLRELAGDPANASQKIGAIKDKISRILSDRLLMDPKDISKEDYVKTYYEELNKTADSIKHMLENVGKESSPAARSAEAIHDNVNFMNQINEMYNYVQLPLKLADGRANGDLYVYTRKKRGMVGPDDQLTALLHLSMDNLGNMDIYLTLQNDKLSTRFCMEKEEMIDFIESHIDELNERLAKKGYNVATTVDVMDKTDESVTDRIVHEEKNLLLSTQSFDARC